MFDSIPPDTPARLSAEGLAWERKDTDTYTLSYLCPVTRMEKHHHYSRQQLQSIDSRLPSALDVLQAGWVGRSVQNGLTKTLQMWAFPRQVLLHQNKIIHWETWDGIQLDTQQDHVVLMLRCYQLIDHATPGLLVAMPYPSYQNIRISCRALESQFPGVSAALEATFLNDMSVRDSAQYCLATLGFPSSYEYLSPCAESVELPDLLLT